MLQLLLHYLYHKTCIPHIVFFKFCAMGNMFFFFTGLASSIFTGHKLAQEANKKIPHYKKGKPYLKEIPQICNVSDYSVDFFLLFTRSTSININYDATSQPEIGISVRMLEKENSNSQSYTCLFCLHQTGMVLKLHRKNLHTKSYAA